MDLFGTFLVSWWGWVNAIILASISVICENQGRPQVNKFEQVSKGDPCMVRLNMSLSMSPSYKFVV